MDRDIRNSILGSIVEHSLPEARNKRSNVSSENKRSLESIIAETASAYTRPKQQVVSDASTPSIDEAISEDGILSYILSHLTLREAVATCVVSPRWRRIWAHRPKLEFGANNLFEDHITHLLYDRDAPLDEEQKTALLMGKTDQFICSVNSVIQQLQLQDRLRIDEFKVRYFLNKSHSHHLDAWVSFAVESKTRVLGLHLHKSFVLDFEEEKYDFPCHLLGSCSSVENLFLISCSLKPPCTFHGLNNLKNLTLYRVDVTEEDITRLLSNCYTLEYLRLHKIQHLVALSIPHPQSHFHTFIAKECDQLRGDIKINAVNLRNLGYHGYPVDIILPKCSQLLEAFFCFRTDEKEFSLDYYLNKIATNLPQLQTLTCTVIGDFKVPSLLRDLKVPNVFIHLRNLYWVWKVSGQMMTVRHLVTLLDTAPFLEELNLSLWSISGSQAAPTTVESLKEKLPKRPHAHLKDVMFVSFRWNKAYAEFTLYLVQNAVELEFMSINNGVAGLDEATTEKLRQLLPAKVKLEILNQF